MYDLKLNDDGDLDISDIGDLIFTNSVVQSVRVRLLWLFNEWRLMPQFGMKYFETVFVKNPNITLIKNEIRKTILSVDEVVSVGNIDFNYDKKYRTASVDVVFSTSEEMFNEEVKLGWKTMV